VVFSNLYQFTPELMTATNISIIFCHYQ